MFSKLIPREGRFFDLFNAHAAQIVEGSRALSLFAGNDVTIVDVATNKVLATVEVGPHPHGIAVPAAERWRTNDQGLHVIAAALYQAFLRTMMPAVGWLFHRDPETYLYIPESLKRYPGQRGVADLMRNAGFANVRYEDRLLGTMGINVGEAPV